MWYTWTILLISLCHSGLMASAGGQEAEDRASSPPFSTPSTTVLVPETENTVEGYSEERGTQSTLEFVPATPREEPLETSNQAMQREVSTSPFLFRESSDEEDNVPDLEGSEGLVRWVTEATVVLAPEEERYPRFRRGWPPRRFSISRRFNSLPYGGPSLERALSFASSGTAYSRRNSSETNSSSQGFKINKLHRGDTLRSFSSEGFWRA